MRPNVGAMTRSGGKERPPRGMATVLALLAGVALVSLPVSMNAQERPNRTPREWSRALVEAMMARNPATWPDTGRLPWSYPLGFALYAQNRVYRSTHDPRYLEYLHRWGDRVVDDSGRLRIAESRLTNLDALQPAVDLVLLYRETGDARYARAATQARRRFDTYPRTSDGGFWHRNPQTPGQLWADGLFMAPILLDTYGEVMGDTAALSEAARQFVVYLSHLRDPRTGLLFHVWDETGKAPWADSVTHRSPIIWARAIGWAAMGLVATLDALPRGHPQRPVLLESLRDLVAALARYQDPATGLWWEVVDRGGAPGNWTEASASAMYTYAIARAVREGYVDRKYGKVAEKGYRGALTKVSVGPDGLVTVSDICEGTNVGGTYEWYVNRQRHENDLHGVGAYILMFDEMGNKR